MEKAKTIKISSRVYEQLHAFAGLLSERSMRRVSVDDALENLLARTPRNRPSDYAGAWVMSDDEAKEIKDSLKELWRTWKAD
jgi:predicted CopG family antitoxin